LAELGPPDPTATQLGAEWNDQAAPLLWVASWTDASVGLSVSWATPLQKRSFRTVFSDLVKSKLSVYLLRSLKWERDFVLQLINVSKSGFDCRDMLPTWKSVDVLEKLSRHSAYHELPVSVAFTFDVEAQRDLSAGAFLCQRDHLRL
jgi:hypothetical protein